MGGDLSHLPRLHIDAVDLLSSGDYRVRGRIDGWRLGMDGPHWFWLWPTDHRAIIPTITALAEDGRIELLVDSSDISPQISSGAELSWLDPYWQAYHVYMIRRGEWEKRRFQSEDAATFTLGRLRGRNRADLPIPEGAVATGIAPGGWDHEHCELCRATIGSGGSEVGYVDPDDHWLCPTCYEAWARPKSLDFLVDLD
jgi:hypothetical protein